MDVGLASDSATDAQNPIFVETGTATEQAHVVVALVSSDLGTTTETVSRIHRHYGTDVGQGLDTEALHVNFSFTTKGIAAEQQVLVVHITSDDTGQATDADHGFGREIVGPTYAPADDPSPSARTRPGKTKAVSRNGAAAARPMATATWASTSATRTEATTGASGTKARVGTSGSQASTATSRNLRTRAKTSGAPTKASIVGDGANTAEDQDDG